MATALIKFSQGLNVGANGQALKGVTGTAVNVENSDNTGIVSWQIDLVYVDPSSGISPATPFAFNDNSNTPFATFTPDVRGSYRFVLSVWDVPNRFGPPSGRDIRIFAVPEVHGLVVPPPQLWPLPLPVPASGLPGNRPHEFNFDDQPDGWAGNGADDGLLNELIRRVDGTLASAKQEILPVSSNGQTAFTLSQATTSDTTVEMYVNGVKQAYGTDYTASSTSLTYLSAVTLQTTDVVEVWYIIGALAGTNCARQETKAVTSNGQTVFTLSQATTSDSTVEMYVNSAKMQYGVEYSATGATVTYTGAAPLQTTDVVEFWYIIGTISGSGGGSFIPFPVTSVKTANYNVTLSDYMIAVDSAGGSFTVTLPASPIGTRFEVSDVTGSASAFPVTVAVSGGDTIIGVATFSIAANYASYAFTKTTSNLWSVS